MDTAFCSAPKPNPTKPKWEHAVSVFDAWHAPIRTKTVVYLCRWRSGSPKRSSAVRRRPYLLALRSRNMSQVSFIESDCRPTALLKKAGGRIEEEGQGRSDTPGRESVPFSRAAGPSCPAPRHLPASCRRPDPVDVAGHRYATRCHRTNVTPRLSRSFRPDYLHFIRPFQLATLMITMSFYND